MATIPSKIEKFSDVEKDQFSSIAEATWKKAAYLLEYLNKSYPIGMLMFFDKFIAPTTTPDPNYWKFCDGSVISNVNSPMNGETTPDLRNKFIKHPNGNITPMTSGGADSINLNHTHG